MVKEKQKGQKKKGCVTCLAIDHRKGCNIYGERYWKKEW